MAANEQPAAYTTPMSLSIPCGVCTSCGREIDEGEKAEVVVRAGSAWKDG